MKHYTLKGIVAFLLMFSFFSCQKENTNLNSPIISPPEITPTDYIDYANQIAEHHVMLKDILILMAQYSVLNPEVFGFQNAPVVETRSCPSTQIVDTNGGFPKTLTLEFGAGGSGCTLQTSYSGSLSFTFNAPLYNAAFFDEEFTLSFNNFVMNGTSFSSAQPILFAFNNGKYLVFFQDDVVTVKDGITTTYKKNPGSLLQEYAELTITDPLGDDDPNVPSTCGNNLYALDIFSGSEVFSTDGTTTTKSCISTNAGDPLIFQPSVCGCYTDGIILLRENTNDDCNNTTTTAFFDYGINMSGANTNVCDGWVGVNGIPEETQMNCN